MTFDILKGHTIRGLRYELINHFRYKQPRLNSAEHLTQKLFVELSDNSCYMIEVVENEEEESGVFLIEKIPKLPQGTDVFTLFDQWSHLHDAKIVSVLVETHLHKRSGRKKKGFLRLFRSDVRTQSVTITFSNESELLLSYYGADAHHFMGGYSNTIFISWPTLRAPDIKQYDTVKLNIDLNEVIRKDMEAVILEIYENGRAFEIECVKKDGTNYNFEGQSTFSVIAPNIRKVS